MAERMYPFAVGRIRVMENRLLKKQQLIQMAEAKNAEEVMRVLKEAGYETEIAETVHGYEAVLAKELEKTNALMKELVPEEKFMDLFLYKNDYHNLKVLLKAAFCEGDGAAYLIGGATVDVELMKKAVETGEYGSLPPIMAKAAQEAYETFVHTQNGQMIDLILDRACFESMKKAADDSKLSFVQDYVAYLCDVTNLKSFYRFKRMKRSMDEFKQVYLAGGHLSEHQFLSAYTADPYWMGFKGSSVGDICAEGMPKGFTEFERLCDNYLMEQVKAAKYVALTVEPLVAYLYAKESELKTVRIIMTGKLNNISAETIKERLRDAYV